MVRGVEADQRGEQPHVGLGDRVAHQVALPGQPLGERVQPGEERPERLVVRLLGGGEPAPVDAVVDVGVDLGHQRVHLGAQLDRVEVRRVRARAAAATRWRSRG